MASATYQTKQSAQLYTKTGRATGVFLSAGHVLECDWLWNTGALTGMRKIVAGPYADYFVLGSDLTLYTPPPPPDPEPVPTEPTTLAGVVVVVMPDGSQLVNRDAIVWVEGTG